MKALPCPTCGRRGTWFNDRHGPFCSERCRMVDLGKWLGEEYRVASGSADQELEDHELWKQPPTDEDSE